MRQPNRRRTNVRGRQGVGDSRDKVIGIVAGGFGIVLLAGMAFFWWSLASSKVVLDAANCPAGGVAAVHAILVDRSDPISPLQRQQVLQHVLSLVADARSGERFDLYVADGDGTNTVAPLVSVCSPGRGADANQLYQNPKMIQRAFEERFLSVLKRAVEQLTEPATRSNSPILESVRAVAVSSFGSTARDGMKLRLTIVSDMVQHSGLSSHLRGETTFAALERRPQWPSLRADLAGVEVSILYLLRPTIRRPGGPIIQNRGHQLFWEQVVHASGGQVNLMKAL